MGPIHSLTNKQLFNFSENPRPEVVFIGVNYVTFVSGYDPSANLSGVLLALVIQQNFSARLLNNDFARAIRRVIGLYSSRTGGLNKSHVHVSFRLRLRLRLHLKLITVSFCLFACAELLLLRCGDIETNPIDSWANCQ